jgi:hypothetical protein
MPLKHRVPTGRVCRTFSALRVRNFRIYCH